MEAEEIFPIIIQQRFGIVKKKMKFCAIICELNPMHRGHKYLFDRVKEEGYDHILCLMSGNFVQRGEAAVFQKYVRARHAVENGADAVIELPAAFAVSPAELFAGGAVHILSSLPNVEALAFGCESGDEAQFCRIAELCSVEDKAFKAALKDNMKDGTSYIRARNTALLARNTEIDEAFLSTPNNILGIEYCRAILAEKSDLRPIPILRIGNGHADPSQKGEFPSSAAVRAAMETNGRREKKFLHSALPPTVFKDVGGYNEVPYRQAALLSLLRAEREKIAAVPDCSEGLENRLCSMAKTNPDYDTLLSKSVTKRYTLSRLKRILMQNFLGVELKQVRDFLSSPLYANVLAVKAESAEEILASLAGEIPVIARKSDFTLLKKDALDCFSLDVRANDLYNALTGTYTNEFLTLFV